MYHSGAFYLRVFGRNESLAEQLQNLCAARADFAVPRVAAELAIACAEAIDREIERLAPAFLSEVEQRGATVRLDRSAHRREHLGQIEKAFNMA